MINFGRYAISLFDKYKGNGVRVSLDAKKLDDWSDIKTWLFKLKMKKEQNEESLMEQIWLAGRQICVLQSVQVKPEYLTRRSKGDIGICSFCGEAYPVKDGKICLGCREEAPYVPISLPRNSINGH
jgi:formylmethanofuran dehydrogenase subunit E